MVEKYNKLVSPNKSIQLQEVESGNFPWKTENNDEDGKPFVLKGLSLLSIELKKKLETKRPLWKFWWSVFCRKQVS